MEFESVCFFLVSGHTFTFRNVKIESDNETMITISYTAMSDGMVKRAVFSKAHVAGVAYTPSKSVADRIAEAVTQGPR